MFVCKATLLHARTLSLLSAPALLHCAAPANRADGVGGTGGNGAAAGDAGSTSVVSAGGNAASSGSPASGSGGASGKSGSSAGATAACTGKRGSLRGASDQTVTAAGVARTFVHYAPSTLDPNEPVPIVIVAHGWIMTGQQMFDITHYDRIADAERFVAAVGAHERGPLRGLCDGTQMGAQSLTWLG
jgi:hypothetical protein